jgi:hypothetical protein
MRACPAYQRINMSGGPLLLCLSKDIRTIANDCYPSLGVLTNMHEVGRKPEFTATGRSGLTFSNYIEATYNPLLTSFDATMACWDSVIRGLNHLPHGGRAGLNKRDALLSANSEKLRTGRVLSLIQEPS